MILAADGSVEHTIGNPSAPVFPRSSNKPMQAAAVVRSHSGETFHIELVLKMLAEHGLTPDDLHTPADLPLDAVEAETYLAAGRVREPVTMNCSGKHAAMLAERFGTSGGRWITPPCSGESAITRKRLPCTT